MLVIYRFWFSPIHTNKATFLGVDPDQGVGVQRPHAEAEPLHPTLNAPEFAMFLGLGYV